MLNVQRCNPYKNYSGLQGRHDVYVEKNVEKKFVIDNIEHEFTFIELMELFPTLLRKLAKNNGIIIIQRIK